MKTTRTQSALRALAMVAIACCLPACDVETFDDAVASIDNNNPPPSPPPTPPPPSGGFNPVFSEVQSNVFTPDCATSGCHSGASPPQGLNLEAANSYAMLVGVPSNQDAGVMRVVAGDPNNSYLIQKLEGTASSGNVMPPGGAIEQSSIDTIRQWISDGALDDTAVVLDPIQVSSISPASGAALDAGPAQVIAGFTRDLDASTVNANTFILEGSGGNGAFDNGDDVAIAAAGISLAAGNPRSAIFDLTGVNLADDTYRIRLLGAGASVIMDLDGNALDGEFSGGFPSGNGAAGGDFQSTFTVTTPVVIGPTLDQIQAVVFTPTCASANCHGGAVPAADLDLRDADTSFMELVGIESTQEPPRLRVAANDPDNSYLIQKLEGNQVVGVQMPVGGMVPQTDIDQIRLWITNGAPR